MVVLSLKATSLSGASVPFQPGVGRVGRVRCKACNIRGGGMREVFDFAARGRNNVSVARDWEMFSAVKDKNGLNGYSNRG